MSKVDWTKVWAKKYPILEEYQNIENIDKYEKIIEDLYLKFKNEFNLNDEDTVLILKDILYKTFKSKK